MQVCLFTGLSRYPVSQLQLNDPSVFVQSPSHGDLSHSLMSETNQNRDTIRLIITGLGIYNKANLRDLIAATGLVILLKLDLNHRFFSHVTLKFDWWPRKNYRAPLLHYIKLCASSQTPRWIRTAVAVRKRSIRVKIGDFLPRVTLKFKGWPWKTIGILFYVTLSFVHYFKVIGEFKLKLQSGNTQFGPKSAIFCPVWP